MKHTVKNTTLKIFFIVLFSGLIGVFGVFLMAYDLDVLSADYKKIIAENYDSIENMGEINKLIYQHQAVVANHIRSEDSREKEAYEEEEAKLRQQLNNSVILFGERMKEKEGLSLYHKVYSNTYSYLKNVDIVFELSWKGDHTSANYFITNSMNSQITNVNDSIEELEKLTKQRLEQAKEELNQKISFYRISAMVGVAAIVVIMICCIVVCVRLTSQLDNYKESLEKEVDNKSREILDNNSKIMKIQNNTVVGMANLIESRDGETGEHIKRTSAYVALLATEAKKRGLYQDILTDEYIELLVRAAPMHDIGKVVVPDYILNKPGRLTDEEFDVMKNHAREGERIVHSVLSGIENDEYLDIASDMAAYHHEKWNGRGYPSGKGEEEIPLCARIMAIADVFDALVSVRCYKKAMSLDDALDIIKKDAGTHFDPVLAEIFLSKRKEVKKIMESE